jgi:hypothetical protein
MKTLWFSDFINKRKHHKLEFVEARISNLLIPELITDILLPSGVINRESEGKYFMIEWLLKFKVQDSRNSGKTGFFFFFLEIFFMRNYWTFENRALSLKKKVNLEVNDYGSTIFVIIRGILFKIILILYWDRN